MIRDFLVVRNTPDMRMILGQVRGCEVDPDEFRRRAAKEMGIPVSELTIIAETIPRRTAPVDTEKLLQQFGAYCMSEIEDEDIADFIGLYHRVQLAGGTVPASTVNCVERFIREAEPLGMSSYADDADENMVMYFPRAMGVSVSKR